MIDTSLKTKVFDQLLVNSAVGVAMIGHDGTFVYCNSAFEEMLGYDAGELVGRTFFDITHEDDMEFARKNWNLRDITPQIPRIEKRYRRKDGSVMHAVLAVTFLGGPKESQLRTFSLVQDVSSAYESLKRLDESNVIFRELTENISSVFWMTDPTKGQMLFVSRAYEHVWGMPREVLFRRPLAFFEAIHQEDRAVVREALARQAVSDYDVEYRVIRPDGSVRYVHDRGFPVRNAAGETYRICGLAEDITERKEREKLIHEQNLQLVASAKLSSVGEMAGSVAHEINSPLATIQLNSEMLREMLSEESPDLGKARERLVNIENTVERIAKVVRSLRRLSRNSQCDPFEKVSAKLILDDALEICQQRLRQSEVELRVSVNPNELELECRPVEISQIVLNLLNNARDAVECLETKWVIVEAESTGSHVEISVTNSGPAISGPVRAKLFTPFFTTKPVGKGTGLGLHICASIANDHAGRIWLDEASPYTRFVLRLPIARQAGL